MWLRISVRKSIAAAAVAAAFCLIAPPATAAQGDALVRNGGFEDGPSGWMWQQWKGKPLPGYIDREDMHEGLASFRLHQDGAEHPLSMAKEIRIDPTRDYQMSIALKPRQTPEGSVRVRILLNGGRGWYSKGKGQVDLVETGGTHDWRTYTIPVRAASLKGAEAITIFVYHDNPSQGSLGIDSLALKPVRGSEASSSSRSAPADAEPGAVTYTTANPMVLFSREDARVAIEATPDRALYRKGALPHIAVRSVAVPGAKLVWHVVDGFGHVLAEKSVAADGDSIDVVLPPGHGYYEVVATLKKGSRTLAEARRSIGALTPPAEPAGDEPFGLWIQGEKYYPELGVRWIRDGIVWKIYHARGDSYLEQKAKRYRWYRDHGIRVLAYPKRHPEPYQISREVIEDTPAAWRAEEEWWTKMVRTLGDYVDAWGVVNEPMRGHWKGSNELIVRYWALMRRIVDHYDPDAPLIGPSLNPNMPSGREQYQNLLGMGFGRYIDGVELHTYLTSPEEQDWDGNTRRIREMTRRATGKDLPIWSTEHGSSATYPNELLQAQFLVRSWLEAKKIGYRVVIWHMFSHPQGSDSREVQFGIFRNAKERGSVPPQPRPAGVAYGVMTRQLAGAEYRTRLDYFGPAIYAYVFERDGKAMVALWTTSGKTYDVTMSVGDKENVTVTGLFGRVETLEAKDGLIHVTVDRNPRFIAPLPASYLRREPIARLDKPLEVLPGDSDRATLTLVNPTSDPARLRLEWLPVDGWQFAQPRNRWTLEPQQSVHVPLTVTASQDLAVGHYQIHAKVFLDGKYVTPLSAQASVLPQVILVGVEPRFEDGQPVLAGTLRRLDPDLREATVQVAGGGASNVSVFFDGHDEAAFAVPVSDPPGARLDEITLTVYGSHEKVQVEEVLRLSFVPAAHVDGALSIDGDLDDWPAGGHDEGLDVRWGWDEQHLYLAVRLPDRRHIQKQSVTQMWKDDSLQIGVAPDREEQLVRASLPGLHEAEMVELDVALRQEGPAMYRHRTVNSHLASVGPVGQEQIRYAVRHDDRMTSYELRIPVAQLGLKPLRRGQVLRTSLLINDDDGRGRRSIEWFGGIRVAKDPSLFGHLILRD